MKLTLVVSSADAQEFKRNMLPHTELHNVAKFQQSNDYATTQNEPALPHLALSLPIRHGEIMSPLSARTTPLTGVIKNSLSCVVPIAETGDIVSESKTRGKGCVKHPGAELHRSDGYRYNIKCMSLYGSGMEEFDGRVEWLLSHESILVRMLCAT